jgi:lysozyme
MLKEDLKKTADGVRKIFKEWEQQGINIEINQDMFDALVSIAYNSGIGSLRNSDFIQDIKKGDFKSAGEKIKMFKVSKNFPGLEIRRQKESQMFLASL